MDDRGGRRRSVFPRPRAEAPVAGCGSTCYRCRQGAGALETVSDKSEAVLRVDQLFQYTLARAACADDFRERELGAIHLLKYAYLADLAHAKCNGGATYTGIRWLFHHFGPWSAAVHQRITPALVEQAGADTRSIPSPDGDYVRYHFPKSRADRIEGDIGPRLPPSVSGALVRAVREHGSDTADLLRHVYLTPPMLAARPNDTLDFTSVVEPDDPPVSPAPRVFRRQRGGAAGAVDEPPILPAAPRVRRTKAEKRRRAVALEAGRKKIRQLLAKRRSARVVPDPPPRYDDVFFAGLEERDREAGTPLKASSGTLSFDDSVWSSSQRRDPEIS